jgi:amino acid transporter
MSFLFVWQTSIQAPLVVASAAIGFAQYLTYLIDLGFWEQKIVSGGLVLFVLTLLYRKIETVGKISVVLGTIVMLTIIWIIMVSGPAHMSLSQRKETIFSLLHSGPWWPMVH